jgi:hypothetical protein
MKRLVLALVAVLLVAMLIPAGALAKGASEARIEGPGLDEPISLAGEGRPGGVELMQLAENAGFFPAAFGQIPDPMLRTRPTGEFGPRYTITYVMPGPNGESARIRQDVYPYAKLSPVAYPVPGQTVTYMEPGQPFFATEKTHGGWYVATSSLKDSLVGIGLPESPPTGGGGSGFPWTVIGAFVAFGLVLAVAALLIRRHGQRRTVTA